MLCHSTHPERRVLGCNCCSTVLERDVMPLQQLRATCGARQLPLCAFRVESAHVRFHSSGPDRCACQSHATPSWPSGVDVRAHSAAPLPHCLRTLCHRSAWLEQRRRVLPCHSVPAKRSARSHIASHSLSSGSTEQFEPSTRLRRAQCFILRADNPNPNESLFFRTRVGQETMEGGANHGAGGGARPVAGGGYGDVGPPR